jgi:hypothetical protein
MVWLADPVPAANVAPGCGASSWAWSAVVSQTDTPAPAAAACTAARAAPDAPDAACAEPGMTAAAPAVASAAALSDASTILMRDMRSSPALRICNK